MLDRSNFAEVKHDKNKIAINTGEFMKEHKKRLIRWENALIKANDRKSSENNSVESHEKLTKGKLDPFLVVR